MTDIRLASRKLWEEVFLEDTPQFLDYYDKYVADHNRIYAEIMEYAPSDGGIDGSLRAQEGDAGELASMLHMNPYRIQVGEKQSDVCYIVAVATKESCRHQGRMRRLLKSALEDAAERQEPFVFLMPASEKIYLPFGFCTVRWQDVMTFGGIFRAPAAQEHRNLFAGRMICRPATREDIPALCAFSQRILARHCAAYAVRDTAYYERMFAEQRAVNGGILLFYMEKNNASPCDDDAQKAKLCGYCFTGREDGAEAWELAIEKRAGQSVWEHDYALATEALTAYLAKKSRAASFVQNGAAPQKENDAAPQADAVKLMGILPGAGIQGIALKEITYRPITMARIVNLPAFVKLLRAEEKLEVLLEVRDDFLPQNSGRYRMVVDQQGGSLQKEGTDIAEPAFADAAKTSAADCAGAKTKNGEARFHAVSIEELTDAFFGVRGIPGLPMEKLYPLRPLYFNELV